MIGSVRSAQNVKTHDVLVDGDDGGEAELRCAVFAVPSLYGPGDGGLVGSGCEDGGQPFEHAVVEGHGFGDEVDLLVVLDDAQLLHKAVCLGDGEARLESAHPCGGQVLGLDAYAARRAVPAGEQAVELFR